MCAHTPHLGVCYYPEHWPEDQWQSDAERMVSAGIRQVRIAEFSWARVEPERGRFDWDWLDKAVKILAQDGLSVTMCTPTATPPKWLVDEIPDMLAFDQNGQPRRFGSRRHYSFSHQGLSCRKPADNKQPLPSAMASIRPSPPGRQIMNMAVMIQP